MRREEGEEERSMRRIICGEECEEKRRKRGRGRKEEDG